MPDRAAESIKFHVIPTDRRCLAACRDELRVELRDAPARLRDRRLVLEHRRNRLADAIRTVTDNSAYYRSLLSEQALQSLGTPSAVAHLPVLERAMLQEHLKELICAPQGPLRLYVDHTSGTVGRPLRVLRDPRSALLESLRLRFILSYYAGDGIPLALGRCAVLYVSHFQGSHEHVYTDPMLNRAQVAKIRCDQGNVADRLRRGSIALGAEWVLSGFPSSLVHLALNPAARERLPNPALILTSGEALLPAVRSLLESTFSTRVYDTYTLREFGMVGFQCRSGPEIHLNADWFLVETRGNGVRSELLISDLRNRTVPVLRYATGDSGALTWSSGCCELSVPTLSALAGRLPVRFLRLGGGIFDPGELAKALEQSGVVWYRITQDTDLRVVLECCPADELARAGVASVARRAGEMLGDTTRVETVFLNARAIPHDGKSGGIRSLCQPHQ